MTNKERHERNKNQKIKGNEAFFDLMAKHATKNWAQTHIAIICPVNYKKKQKN